MKIKVGEQPYLSHHRLLMKKSGDGFTYNHVQILTKNKFFDNTDKSFNFYQITDDFDGIVLVVNQNNETVQFSSFKNSLLVKPSITGKMVAPTCVYLGWLYDDGDFEPLMLIGCFGGGGDPSDNGGYPPHVGGGGGFVSGSTTTINIVASGPKIDPKKENKCFDVSQTAELTIYIQQGKEGTRELVGPNEVGHVFIGLNQNGIERYYGFYPETGANTALVAVGKDYSSELKDNSKELYPVSITKTVSAKQLNSIINYANNPPATYNVNSYACTDFGIAIGKLGGINLPSTKSSSFTFNGTSPGNLGENVRKGNFPNTSKTLT